MPTGVRPRLGPLRFLRAPPSPEMVHGYDHSQRNQRLEASYDSVLEHDLNDLVPPELAGAHQSTSSGSQRGSVYGGVAPTERGNALTNNSIHTNSPRSVHSDRTLIPPRPSHGARQSLPLSAAPSTSHQAFYTQSRHSLPPVPSGAHYPPSFPPPPRFLEQPRSIQVGHIVPSDLPAFSRWSPTWVSGGYSGDGRGFTEHPPTARAESAWEGEGAQPYPYLESQDRYGRREGDEEEEGWVAEGGRHEWEGTGGEYRHGVGFEEPVSEKDKRKVKDRMRRLEREFGEKKGAGGGGWEGLSMNERMKRVKEERRKEKVDLVERSGVDSKGRLVVLGRRKRVALRWLQGSGALGVGVGSIGSALVRPSPRYSDARSLANPLLCSSRNPQRLPHLPPPLLSTSSTSSPSSPSSSPSTSSSSAPARTATLPPPRRTNLSSPSSKAHILPPSPTADAAASAATGRRARIDNSSSTPRPSTSSSIPPCSHTSSRTLLPASQPTNVVEGNVVPAAQTRTTTIPATRRPPPPPRTPGPCTNPRTHATRTNSARGSSRPCISKAAGETRGRGFAKSRAGISQRACAGPRRGAMRLGSEPGVRRGLLEGGGEFVFLPGEREG